MTEQASPDSPPLLVERHDGDILLLLINRRRALNTVSFALWESFSAILDEVERDTPLRALVIAGAGDFFSAGGDVKHPPARGEGALAPAARLELGQRILARLRRLPVPVIAAVEGGAFGFGWALALSADLLFAADNARFGAPFLQFGTVPDGGMTWLIERQIGRLRAAELIFSGRTIEASEALALGLVSRLTPPGQAVAAALEFAAAIGHGNRQASELAKRLLQGASEMSLEASQAQELAYCAICQVGEEAERAREEFRRQAEQRAAAKAAGQAG
jgi:enoyl-CoA hydratase/carnithine racemase